MLQCGVFKLVSETINLLSKHFLVYLASLTSSCRRKITLWFSSLIPLSSPLFLLLILPTSDWSFLEKVLLMYHFTWWERRQKVKPNRLACLVCSARQVPYKGAIRSYSWFSFSHPKEWHRDWEMGWVHHSVSLLLPPQSKDSWCSSPTPECAH